MTTETEKVQPLTNNEIQQLREIAEAGHEVKLGNRELRAFLASLDELNVTATWQQDRLVEGLRPQPEPLSPTVAIQILARAVMALCRSNPGDAWQHMRQLGELDQAAR